MQLRSFCNQAQGVLRMPANIFSFLDIEQALMGVAFVPWKKKAKGVVKQMIDLVAEGKDEQALQLVAQLRFDDEVLAVAPKVDFYMASALLLGASEVSGSVKDNVFMKDGMPDVADTAHLAFNDALQINAFQFLIKNTEKVVADYKTSKENDILKADIKTKSDLARALNEAVIGSGKAIADVAGNLTTSRLVSYGFLSEAKQRGIAKYQLEAVLDNRTSEICRRLHGRTFDVEAAFNMIDAALRVTNSDDFKTVHPWVSGTKQSLYELEHQSDSELQARGVLVPPFHPNCRTTLRLVGEVFEPAEPLFTPITFPKPKPEPLPAAPSDLEKEKELGLVKYVTKMVSSLWPR